MTRFEITRKNINSETLFVIIMSGMAGVIADRIYDYLVQNTQTLTITNLPIIDLSLDIILFTLFWFFSIVLIFGIIYLLVHVFFDILDYLDSLNKKLGKRPRRKKKR